MCVIIVLLILYFSEFLIYFNWNRFPNINIEILGFVLFKCRSLGKAENKIKTIDQMLVLYELV